MEPHIRSAVSWLTLRTWDSRPWLVLGKGPTFERIGELNLEKYRILCLNDTVREVRCDLAHAIDLEVALRCADKIDENAKMLVMPWQPHQSCNVGKDTLPDLVEKHAILEKLWKANRLLCYDHCYAKKRSSSGLVIRVHAFSAEAAIDLLGHGGAREIVMLGVDGGKDYAKSFSDLTPLENRQPSFDKQWKGIAEAADRHGIKLISPLEILAG
jgi:hypothetical protein